METAATIQAKVSDDAESILDQLNTAINDDVAEAAGQGLDASVVDTSDLDSHNVCAGRSAWIFSPTGQLHLYLAKVNVFTYQFGSGQPMCIDPSRNEIRHNPEPVEIGTKKFGITLTFQVNCMPHPTVTGQQQLAADFLDQGAATPDPQTATRSHSAQKT